ncbi:hypothetical protein D018_0346B, partial [Vibrio parahaemolyticus VP2007-007]
GSLSFPASTAVSFNASLGVQRPPTPTTAFVAAALAAFSASQSGSITLAKLVVEPKSKISRARLRFFMVVTDVVKHR